KQLWEHTPLTDFWRIGHGTARKLALHGIITMGDVARCSLRNQELLYRLFGVNAELIIDHAWGWEPVTMEMVKAYRPETTSMSSGQVLHNPYSAQNARNVLLEMADAVSLELTEKRLLTDQIVLTVGYDAESLKTPGIYEKYDGGVRIDHYGRRVPAHAHGTVNIERPTSSGKIIIQKVGELYDRIVDRNLLVRRLTLSINRLIEEGNTKSNPKVEQLDLFSDYEEVSKRRKEEIEQLEKEHRRQQAVVKIRKMFGKNAILKGLNFNEGATQRERNQQIGGHHE
ncbi:MAG: DNA methylase, partial [Muribaculaceae bacterium]|nr:DNA methylase [Muribaculaceae bacterium]